MSKLSLRHTLCLSVVLCLSLLDAACETGGEPLRRTKIEPPLPRAVPRLASSRRTSPPPSPPSRNLSREAAPGLVTLASGIRRGSSWRDVAVAPRRDAGSGIVAKRAKRAERPVPRPRVTLPRPVRLPEGARPAQPGPRRGEVGIVQRGPGAEVETPAEEPAVTPEAKGRSWVGLVVEAIIGGRAEVGKSAAEESPENAPAGERSEPEAGATAGLPEGQLSPPEAVGPERMDPEEDPLEDLEKLLEIEDLEKLEPGDGPTGQESDATGQSAPDRGKAFVPRGARVGPKASEEEQDLVVGEGPRESPLISQRARELRAKAALEKLRLSKEARRAEARYFLKRAREAFQRREDQKARELFQLAVERDPALKDQADEFSRD